MTTTTSQNVVDLWAAQAIARKKTVSRITKETSKSLIVYVIYLAINIAVLLLLYKNYGYPSKPKIKFAPDSLNTIIEKGSWAIYGVLLIAFAFLLILILYELLSTISIINKLPKPPKIEITPDDVVINRGGMTLYDLAYEVYGDPSKWRVILQANKGKTMPDGHKFIGPELLKVGWILRCPNKSITEAHTIEEAKNKAITEASVAIELGLEEVNEYNDDTQYNIQYDANTKTLEIPKKISEEEQEEEQQEEEKEEIITNRLIAKSKDNSTLSTTVIDDRQFWADSIEKQYQFCSKMRDPIEAVTRFGSTTWMIRMRLQEIVNSPNATDEERIWANNLLAKANNYEQLLEEMASSHEVSIMAEGITTEPETQKESSTTISITEKGESESKKNETSFGLITPPFDLEAEETDEDNLEIPDYLLEELETEYQDLQSEDQVEITKENEIEQNEINKQDIIETQQATLITEEQHQQETQESQQTKELQESQDITLKSQDITLIDEQSSDLEQSQLETKPEIQEPEIEKDSENVETVQQTEEEQQTEKETQDLPLENISDKTQINVIVTQLPDTFTTDKIIFAQPTRIEKPAELPIVKQPARTEFVPILVNIDIEDSQQRTTGEPIYIKQAKEQIRKNETLYQSIRPPTARKIKAKNMITNTHYGALVGVYRLLKLCQYSEPAIFLLPLNALYCSTVIPGEPTEIIGDPNKIPTALLQQLESATPFVKASPDKTWHMRQVEVATQGLRSYLFGDTMRHIFPAILPITHSDDIYTYFNLRSSQSILLSHSLYSDINTVMQEMSMLSDICYFVLPNNDKIKLEPNWIAFAREIELAAAIEVIIEDNLANHCVVLSDKPGFVQKLTQLLPTDYKHKVSMIGYNISSEADDLNIFASAMSVSAYKTPLISGITKIHPSISIIEARVGEVKDENTLTAAVALAKLTEVAPQGTNPLSIQLKDLAQSLSISPRSLGDTLRKVAAKAPWFNITAKGRKKAIAVELNTSITIDALAIKQAIEKGDVNKLAAIWIAIETPDKEGVGIVKDLVIKSLDLIKNAQNLDPDLQKLALNSINKALSLLDT
jgi:hypothetical protein